MELSGEILVGHFFSGIPGPQFMSHRAFRQLPRGLPEDAVFWMCATDPASLYGLPLTGTNIRFASNLMLGAPSWLLG